jgi:hypothetical protein
VPALRFVRHRRIHCLQRGEVVEVGDTRLHDPARELFSLLLERAVGLQRQDHLPLAPGTQVGQPVAHLARPFVDEPVGGLLPRELVQLAQADAEVDEEED